MIHCIRDSIGLYKPDGATVVAHLRTPSRHKLVVQIYAVFIENYWMCLWTKPAEVGFASWYYATCSSHEPGRWAHVWRFYIQSWQNKTYSKNRKFKTTTRAVRLRSRLTLFNSRHLASSVPWSSVSWCNLWPGCASCFPALLLSRRGQSARL